MCKITFSHIIEENGLRKGLFQLNDDMVNHYGFDHEPSTDSSDEHSEESVEEIRERKGQQVQNDILSWFNEKLIYPGNPEDLIYKHIEKQKTIILPKKVEVIGLCGNKMRMNNLLSRRSAKLLEVNVSG